MTKAIEVLNVTKKFGKRYIFKNLNLSVEDGSLLQLLDQVVVVNPLS